MENAGDAVITNSFTLSHWAFHLTINNYKNLQMNRSLTGILSAGPKDIT